MLQKEVGRYIFEIMASPTSLKHVEKLSWTKKKEKMMMTPQTKLLEEERQSSPSSKMNYWEAT